MAKRKTKKTRRTTRRRGRLSGISAGGFMPAVAVAAGAVAVSIISKKIPATINPKVVAGGYLVAGAILAAKVKNPIGQGLGYALAAAGGVSLASQFGLISGINGIGSTIPFRMLAPARQMSIVGNPEGSPQPSVIQGGIGNPQGSAQPFILAGAELLG